MTRKPGRMWARASLICAVWSLFIAPAVLGPLGVAAGMVAVAKGDRWWGGLGVSVVDAAAAIRGLGGLDRLTPNSTASNHQQAADGSGGIT